jgi:hypothetical protein
MSPSLSTKWEHECAKVTQRIVQKPRIDQHFPMFLETSINDTIPTLVDWNGGCSPEKTPV